MREAIQPWKKGLAALAAALLGACIQGPWDYYPENPPVFRGLWLSGYAMAGQPLTQVCIEKLLDLSEERTDAFSFYDSAAITVTGRFGGATRTVALSRRADEVNCFAGDPADTVSAGSDYLLEARVVWDSAGKPVTSRLSATAQVPDSFSIRKSAVAPSFALTGQAFGGNIFTPRFFLSLPPDVQRILADEYLDEYTALAGDTAAQAAFIRKNGQKIRDRIQALLLSKFEVYDQYDTVYYMGGVLNTASHYFTSDYSGDVGGVLITHRFDSTAERAETAFDRLFGIEPDSSEFYFRGSVRRLGLYPAVTGPAGYNLLDSIGFVNVWFHTGLNRIYFYGMEDAYVDYVETAVNGEGDPRIRARYNVTGGAGFFVGGVPDSFDVFIRLDSLTRGYSMPEVRAYECTEDGWFVESGCAEYYRPWCQGKRWEPRTCGLDAVRANLEGRLLGDTALVNATESALDSVEAAQDTAALAGGTLRFCVEREFPDLGGTCDAARSDCGRPGVNACKEAWWDFCKDMKWSLGKGCGPALAWYCRDNPRRSEVLCREADRFCRENPGEAACR